MVQRVVGISALLFIILSFVVYVAVPTATSCFDVDSTGYHKIATHYCSQGVLCDPQAPGQAPVQTVGYHFIVGTLYKLFGCTPGPVLFFHILLALCALWLVFRIACFFFDLRVAACSIVLCALNVGFVVYPQFLLAETVLLTMSLACIERFLSFWTTGRTSSLIVAGIIGGCSLLVKPSLLLFFFIAALFLVVMPPCKQGRVKNMLLFVCMFLLPLAGYLTYNKVQYGYFNLAPMKSLNIYYVFLSKVIARVQHIPIEQAEKQIPRFSSSNSLDERGWDGARTLFWHYAQTYPGTCCVVWTENVVKTLCGLYSTQLKLLLNPLLVGGDVSFFKEQGPWYARMYHYIERGSPSWIVTFVAFCEALWSVLRYLLVLCAFCFLLYTRRYATFLFFLMFIGLGVGMTGFDGCCRYRSLVEPFLIMLSSMSLVVLYDRMRGQMFFMKQREHLW